MNLHDDEMRLVRERERERNASVKKKNLLPFCAAKFFFLVCALCISPLAPTQALREKPCLFSSSSSSFFSVPTSAAANKLLRFGTDGEGGDDDD